jgi:membrane protease YdiL (CAAX protease family)
VTPELAPPAAAPPILVKPSLGRVLLQASGDFLLYLAVMLGAGTLLAAPLLIRSAEPNLAPLGGAFFYSMVSLAALGFALYRIRQLQQTGVAVIAPTDRPKPGWWRWTLFGILIVAGATVADNFALHALHTKAGEHPLNELIRLAIGPSLVVAILFIVVIGPAAEELLFRGCIFGRFRAYGHWLSGALFSTILFAALHPIPTLLPVYFALGFVLAWVAHRTESLWPSMALHALNNVIGIVIIRTSIQ